VTEPTSGESAAPRRRRFRSVLFVCAANTVRSVMAEHMLRRELKSRAVDGEVKIASAGIAPYARDGALISLDTRLALRDDGIRLEDDATATRLDAHPELLERADLIIAMTDQQVEQLCHQFAEANSRPVFTLKSFIGETGDIEDPFENGEQAFVACRKEIKRLVERMASLLLNED